MMSTSACNSVMLASLGEVFGELSVHDDSIIGAIFLNSGYGDTRDSIVHIVACLEEF